MNYRFCCWQVFLGVAFTIFCSNFLLPVNDALADGQGDKEFTGQPALTDDQLAEILIELPNLTHLNLLACRLLTDKCLPHIARLEQLEVLGLPEDATFTTNGLKALVGKNLRMNDTRAFLDGTPERFGLWLRTYADVSHLNNDEFGNKGCWDFSKHAGAGDKWIAQVAGLPGIRKLTLSPKGTTDDGLALLAEVPDLTWLVLRLTTDVSDRGLAAIAKCGNLKILNLYGGEEERRVTAKGLESLAGLELEELSIPHWLQTEEALAPYVQAVGLKSRHRKQLNFGKPGDSRDGPVWPLTRKSLAALKGASSIERVFISRGAADALEEDAMQLIWSLPDLQSMWIESPVQGTGFTGCDTTPRLREITILDGSQLRDKCFEELAKSRSVTSVTVHGAKLITEKGLQAFADCKQLEKLDLRGLMVDSQLVDVKLQKALPGCRISLLRGR
jgi:hypothetical protein